MFRSMSRIATVAVVALTLVLLTVPSAQARSFDLAGPSLSAGSGWFDAALSWLGQILFGEQQPAPQKATANSDVVLAGDMDGYGHLNSGSCIDPEGRPRPCPVF